MEPAPVPVSTSADAEDKIVWLYQAQNKIYPRAVSGWFVTWRWLMVWITQLVFYGTPWLAWNHRQAILFDLGARRFYLFGLILYPQDFIYLSALLMICAYGLFLFTAVGGRLWCGYACPQTVYTEIFLWIERKWEGDRAARMKLDAGGMSLNKLLRKGCKQLTWIAVGLWTGFTFVGYFTPIHTLGAEVLALNLGSWEQFWVLFYGFVTYGNAGYMREQVCKYMCPYARFQSAMFDKDTLIISYEAERGEPRGSRSRKADPKALGLGDCIDCKLCVQVCPTGIDIRKGLQYECIGCAACVDVCDEVMDKMGYAKGLVRYDTQNGMAQHLTRAQLIRRVLRPRILVYTGILLLISSALVWSLATRTPFKVDVVRDRASLARMVGNGFIENVYRVQVMNAAEEEQHYVLSVDGLNGLKIAEGQQVTVAPTEAKWQVVTLQLPPETVDKLEPGAHDVHLTVQRVGADPVSVREKTTFVLPR